MAEQNGNILEAVQLRKEFGGLVAVNDVDFSIPRKAIVSLIGPNGAGKTTFFNMLTGVYKPPAASSSSRGSRSRACRPTRSPTLGWRARSRTSASSTT